MHQSVTEWLNQQGDIWNINLLTIRDGFGDDIKRELGTFLKEMVKLYKNNQCHGSLETSCQFINGRFSIGGEKTRLTDVDEVEFMRRQDLDLMYLKELTTQLVFHNLAPHFNTVENAASLVPVLSHFFQICDDAIAMKSVPLKRFTAMFTFMNPLFFTETEMILFLIKAATLRDMSGDAKKQLSTHFDQLINKEFLSSTHFKTKTMRNCFNYVIQRRNTINPLYEVALYKGNVKKARKFYRFLGQAIQLYWNDWRHCLLSKTFISNETFQYQHRRRWAVLGGPLSSLWYLTMALCRCTSGAAKHPAYHMDSYIEIMVNETPIVWEC